MRLLIEEYQYDSKDVAEVLDGLFNLQDVEGKVSVNYVGYFYNPKIKDCVFILPKVLVNDDGKVFGAYDPEKLINLDKAEIKDDKQKKFIYEFAVWIHRALVVFRDSHDKSEIILQRQIETEGRGSKRRSNTWLDVILALVRFNRENQSFFTFILKNIHSGFNKINWGKTIANTTAVVQGEEPIYLRPVNKKRQVNFDEELIIIFFSILNYISKRFGFKSEIPFGFKLITGSQFERYMNGYGRRRLREIKYKYYADLAVRLWELCYAFFDKEYQINMAVDQREYLLAKSFHIVFEAIIQELIGDDDVPKGLAEQEDGKLVDHFYTYKALISNREPENDIYYIGDSKYYKIGHNPKDEAVYKQYTYARNVIQWNLNLFLPDEKHQTDEQLAAKRRDKGRFGQIKLRDDVTEGYNVIPNFFISANIPQNEDGTANLIYDDITVEHNPQPPISKHFNNRLYDRDTLLLSHYDVNFLYVLSLYARNNSGAKEAYKATVREKFRESIQRMLEDHYSFYAMQPHEGVDVEKYFREHFKTTLGKTYTPFDSDNIFSLALEGDQESEENKEILSSLRESFYVAPCKLGEEPSLVLETEKAATGEAAAFTHIVKDGNFLFGVVNKYKDSTGDRKEYSSEYKAFANREATDYLMRNMPGGDIMSAKYFIPMFDGGISGYYEILSIKFGHRQTDMKTSDGIIVRIPMPCLNIKLGKYTPLGDHTKEVPKFRNWNGQIHTAEEVFQLYNNNLA